MFAELFAGLLFLLDMGLAGGRSLRDAVMADGEGRLKRGADKDTLWRRDELSIMHGSKSFSGRAVGQATSVKHSEATIRLFRIPFVLFLQERAVLPLHDWRHSC